VKLHTNDPAVIADNGLIETRFALGQVDAFLWQIERVAVPVKYG
jgi:hypothetical protein